MRNFLLALLPVFTQAQGFFQQFPMTDYTSAQNIVPQPALSASGVPTPNCAAPSQCNANMCVSNKPVVPYMWCNSNFKSYGTYQTLNFNVTFPTTGYYTLGLEYSATYGTVKMPTNPAIGIYIDGLPSFGYVSTSALPDLNTTAIVQGNLKYLNAVAGSTHKISILNQGGNFQVYQFFLTTDLSVFNHTTSVAPSTTTTTAIVTTSGTTTMPVDQQVNVPTSDVQALGTPAIIGIAVGGAVFVIIVIVLTVVIVRRNKTKASPKEGSAATGSLKTSTPAVVKAEEGNKN